MTSIFEVENWGNNQIIIQVPATFPTCLPTSQFVPQHVPKNTSPYPISLALSSTLVTYIKENTTICHIFGDCPKFHQIFL